MYVCMYVCMYASTQNALDEPSGDDALVVRDIHPIIHIGTTAIYTREITELEGRVPFRTKKQPKVGMHVFNFVGYACVQLL